MNWIFRPATPADWPAVADLLTRVNLPLEGALEHIDEFIVAFSELGLDGVSGLEIYDDTGLLRSVAVAKRGTGLGLELVNHLIQRAKDQKLSRIILLTTTAADYFERLNFKRIGRDEAPKAVQESLEFKSACPASAVVMELKL
jgi:N-acetylglutamate synthase-like GNAT family acetyltransferase